FWSFGSEFNASGMASRTIAPEKCRQLSGWGPPLETPSISIFLRPRCAPRSRRGSAAPALLPETSQLRHDSAASSSRETGLGRPNGREGSGRGARELIGLDFPLL